MQEATGWIRSVPGGVVLAVRVVPRASRDQIQGFMGDALKVRLRAPPVEGKANAALLEFLAEKLDIPPRALGLLAGQAGRHKRVHVSGVTEDEVRRIVSAQKVKNA